jgi:hypothetical protein
MQAVRSSIELGIYRDTAQVDKTAPFVDNKTPGS